MTIRLLTAWNGYPVNALLTLDAGTETGLVGQHIADTVLAGGVAYTAPIDRTTVNGGAVLYGDYTVTAADDGVIFNCTTALTITIPELLSPRPSFIVNPPATGNVSLDPTGAAQLNGAGTTLTRSRANNPAGVAVVAYAESDGYGVSGS